jgi:hypothetical protein
VAKSKVWPAYFDFQVSAGDKHGVNAMDQLDIETNIRKFIQGNGQNNGLQPAERYASFDYCFNYFQCFREKGFIDQLSNPENIQLSCLQLCFYLASWGMLRGSSTLLQKSAKFYELLIIYIASAPQELWEIDADSYSPTNIELLLECRRGISMALSPCGASDTLATKIMLGVFGNVPAFDSAFKSGFGVSTFGRFSLGKIQQFYIENQEVIEKHRVPTIDFISGEPTQQFYTRAKVIDMIFFIEGSKNE